MKNLISVLVCLFLIFNANILLAQHHVRNDLIVHKGVWYDIRAYGAIINDGNSDVVAIQTAIDSCESQGGGTVYFPPGIYEIGFNSSIQVHGNMMIKGAGIGATKFNYTKTSGSPSVGKPAFIIYADSNIVFCDFEIDGNAVDNGNMGEFDTGILLFHADCKNVWIERLYIHDTAGDAIEVNLGSNVYISDCRIHVPYLDDSWSPQVGRNGISALNVDGLFINKCILSGNSLPANIDIEPAAGQTGKNIIVSDNIISGGFYGISLNGNACVALDSILIHNNIISSTDSMAVRNWSVSNYTFTNNLISSANGAGFELRPGQSEYKISNNEIHNCDFDGILVGQNCSDIEISNNRCYENGLNGIRIAGDVAPNRNSFFTIRNNTCWNNSQGSSDTYSGIYINYTDSSFVSGNFCYDNQASPTQKYGIVLENATDLELGLNNSGYNNATGLISMTSVVTTNNLGVATLNKQLLFNRPYAADNELVFFYDPDFASLTMQSGGHSRWWIVADTTGYGVKLLIGGVGNTTPAVADFPLSIGEMSLTVSDSLQITSGAWIRKIFWSTTGDSLGIIGYNTVDSKLDTAWAVTK